MLHVSSAVSSLEKTTLMDVDQSIANIYGKFAIKRTYDSRLSLDIDPKYQNHISLKIPHFIPFTQHWFKTRKKISESRRIYIRFELLETAIILYFGGFAALKKTIAGVHSPYMYASPIGYRGKLHNYIYSSFLTTWLLSKMNKIHVLNNVDYQLFTKKLNLTNVYLIPNFINISTDKITKSNDTKNLHIAFIGELSKRKGTDILINVIHQASNNLFFHISGDGILKGAVEQAAKFPNVKYHGYLDQKDLRQLYLNCDVLFVPSRAESFSLAALEAMSYGLPIVSSSNTHIGLPLFIQQINEKGTVKGYLKQFEELLEEKKEGKLYDQKKDIQEYTKGNFSTDLILPKLFNTILDIKIS
jgi:glycosyltransferase involved in cell wall biosynthesis